MNMKKYGIIMMALLAGAIMNAGDVLTLLESGKGRGFIGISAGREAGDFTSVHSDLLVKNRRQSAEFLAEYLKKATGADFPVQEKTDGAMIVLRTASEELPPEEWPSSGVHAPGDPGHPRGVSHGTQEGSGRRSQRS